MIQTANDAWLDMVRDVMDHGEIVESRDGPTREILNRSTTIDMGFPVVTVRRRRMGYRFMAAEAHWILTGNNRVTAIQPYSKIISQFSDDGFRFDGAYGPKVVDQLSWAIQNLQSSSTTRQCVINIWRERPGPSKDIPCTLSLQFFLRRDPRETIDRIHTVATMRSSDAWLGWVYDVFNFTMITAYIALHLHISGMNMLLGKLHINTGSQHIYKRNWASASECINRPDYWTYKRLCLDYVSPRGLITHLDDLKDRPETVNGFLSELKELNDDRNTATAIHTE